jgi:predicted metal-dependent enzyme (double-stranded beta helix superfamily)
MANNRPSPINTSRRELLARAAAVSAPLIVPLLAGANPKTAAAATRTTMDIDRFVADCVAANQDSTPQAAVLEVLKRAVHTPRAVLAAVGEPRKAGITVLHRSSTLTIFSAVWTPQMNLMPHNHLMWANIGIYTGREDNLLWRKSTESIEAYSAKALFEGDAAALPVDAIHSVTNPLMRFTGGIHIYGGDFFDTTRTQWNAETLEAEPSNGAVIRGIFERENERYEQHSGPRKDA